MLRGKFFLFKKKKLKFLHVRLQQWISLLVRSFDIFNTLLNDWKFLVTVELVNKCCIDLQGSTFLHKMVIYLLVYSPLDRDPEEYGGCWLILAFDIYYSLEKQNLFWIQLWFLLFLPITTKKAKSCYYIQNLKNIYRKMLRLGCGIFCS